MSDSSFAFGVGVIFGVSLGVVLFFINNLDKDTWKDDAIGVCKGEIVCEQALEVWICKRGVSNE